MISGTIRCVLLNARLYAGLNAIATLGHRDLPLRVL